MDDKTLRRVQLVQLEIAKEIKRICDENGINCFLTDGSLLGAIRHKGFIPWDDDLDMGMSRADYEKFLRIAPGKLSPKYTLVDWNIEKGFPHPMAKVLKNGTVLLEESRNDDGHKGIWVDVFAFDNYPDRPEDAARHGRKLTIYKAIIRAKCKYATWRSHNKTDIKKYIKNIPFRVIALFCKKESVVSKFEKEAVRFNNTKTKYCFENGPLKYGTIKVPSEYIESFIETEFEDTTFKVPLRYDEYLRCEYGDYMKLPPESQRKNVHSIVKVDFGDE